MRTKRDGIERMVERGMQMAYPGIEMEQTRDLCILLLRRRDAYWRRRVNRIGNRVEKDCRKVRRIVGKNNDHALGMLDGVQALRLALKVSP